MLRLTRPQNWDTTGWMRLVLFILLLPLCCILFFQCLTYTLCIVANARSGYLQQLRSSLPVGAVLNFTRAFGRSLASVLFLLLVFPLHKRLELPCRETKPGSGPVIILIHGLYHNASAWVLLRRGLQRAGFTNICTWSYTSWGQDFETLAGRLVKDVTAFAERNPGQGVVLIGHSLGGLLGKEAVYRIGDSGCITALISLATPHRGSLLARAGINTLARSLASSNVLFSHGGRPWPAQPVKCLNLYPAVDNMVLPGQALVAPEPGWEQHMMGPLGHVGILFDRTTLARCRTFLQELSGHAPS